MRGHNSNTFLSTNFDNFPLNVSWPFLCIRNGRNDFLYVLGMQVEFPYNKSHSTYPMIYPPCACVFLQGNLLHYTSQRNLSWVCKGFLVLYISLMTFYLCNKSDPVECQLVWAKLSGHLIVLVQGDNKMIPKDNLSEIIRLISHFLQSSQKHCWMIGKVV